MASEQNRTPLGEYRYTRASRLIYTAVLCTPIVYCLVAFVMGGQGMADVFAAAAFILVPLTAVLLIRYWTFRIILDAKTIQVRQFFRTEEIPYADLTSVRTGRMNLVLESVYVRSRTGKRFAFDRGLERYEELKRFLIQESEGNIEYHEQTATGRHTYAAWYKSVLALILLLVWTLLIKVVPISAIHDQSSSVEPDAVALSLILLVIAVPGVFVALRDFTFELNVGPDAVEATWLGRSRKISLNSTPSLSISRWLPGEVLSLVGASGEKIVVSNALTDYESVKRYLTRRCAR